MTELRDDIDFPYSEEELLYQKQVIEEWESILHSRVKNPDPKEVEKLSPAVAGKNISEDMMVELLYKQCPTRNTLRNWIKVFLGVDLPDTTVDPTSNSNPLEMVWKLYETAVWYDKLEPHERVIRSIFYASRGSFKTIGLTIAELLIMLHSGRDTIHCALIEKQSKNAYNKYFRPFLDKPFVKEEAKISSILEQSIIKNRDGKEISLGVIPCTMNATSGPRAHLLVFDEIDKAKGEQLAAYQNAYGMRTATPDKKLPMTVGISTRDSSFGVIQDEIDNADKRGTKVYHWNIIDITEKCPDSRSLRKPIPIYIKTDTLYCISEEQYKKLASSEQKAFQKEWGLEGCIKNCKIFAACKGYLKNQKSKCGWLKSIEDTQQAILSAPSEDMAIAQLLCRKPPTTGLVFSDFTKTRNVKKAHEMYRTFMGVAEEDHVDENITIEDFIDILIDHEIPIFMGVDAGFHNPCATLVAIDKQENIYVLKEYRPHNVDSPELAQYLGEYWGKYVPDLTFSDPESPDCASALRKKRFRISTKVDKAVQLGIATLKGYIRVPGTDRAKFFMHEDCKVTIKEFAQKYKYKQNTDGTYSDDPDKKDDHGPDSVRYVIHTLLGQAKAQLWSNTLHSKEVTKEQIIGKQLAPDNVVKKAYGPTGVVDNRKDFLDQKDDTGKKQKVRKRSTHDFTKY